MVKKGLHCLVMAAALTLNSGCLAFWNSMLTDRTDIKTSDVPSAVKKKNDGGKIRIMTYNIAHGRGDNGISKYPGMGGFFHELGLNTQITKDSMKKRLDMIASLIRREDPDIVVLNEVDFRTGWSFDVDQLRYLAEKTRIKYYAYGTKWDFLSIPFHIYCGNGVLSKYPITGNNRYFHEPNVIDSVIGQQTYMDVMLEDGAVINLLATHLDDIAFGKRKTQVDELKRALKHQLSLDVATILAGDLNAEPPAAVKARGGKDTTIQDILSIGKLKIYKGLENNPDSIEARQLHTSDDNKTIDHIIVSKHFDYKRCFVPKSDGYHMVKMLSDHRPMICDIELKK